MNQAYITDITHFLDKKGFIPHDLSEPTRAVIEKLGAIVAAVTREPGFDPDIQCWSKINRKPCPGQIEADFAEESDEIIWDCFMCGNSGTISNWKNTFWDCRYSLQEH